MSTYPGWRRVVDLNEASGVRWVVSNEGAPDDHAPVSKSTGRPLRLDAQTAHEVALLAAGKMAPKTKPKTAAEIAKVQAQQRRKTVLGPNA